jgi:hypothetical protein
MRYQVFTAAKMWIVVLLGYDMTPCGLRAVTNVSEKHIAFIISVGGTPTYRLNLL